MIMNHFTFKFMLFWSIYDFDLKILVYQLLKGVVTNIVIFRPRTQATYTSPAPLGLTFDLQYWLCVSTHRL